MEQIPQHIIYLLSKSKLEGLRDDEKLKLDLWGPKLMQIRGYVI